MILDAGLIGKAEARSLAHHVVAKTIFQES
jgi:hypothetical protein